MDIKNNSGQVNVSNDSSSLYAQQNINESPYEGESIDAILEQLSENISELPEEISDKLSDSIKEFKEETSKENPKSSNFVDILVKINQVIPIVSSFPKVVDGIEKMSEFIKRLING